MSHHTALENLLPFRTSNTNSLRDRADDVLIAVAVLGLIATIADGEPDLREVETFTRDFRRRFALSRAQALRIIDLASSRVESTHSGNPLDGACDTLNEYLNASQKLDVFETLSDVLVADGRIHQGEEDFFLYVASRLDLLELLEDRYPNT